MARLYSNENFPFQAVEELRRLGHDVLTIQETGKANQQYPDESVLASASVDDRIVLTINRCIYDPCFAGQASRIDEAIRANEPLVGQLIRVNRPG